jgi:hypothetical protein
MPAAVVASSVPGAAATVGPEAMLVACVNSASASCPNCDGESAPWLRVA